MRFHYLLSMYAEEFMKWDIHGDQLQNKYLQSSDNRHTLKTEHTVRLYTYNEINSKKESVSTKRK